MLDLSFLDPKNDLQYRRMLKAEKCYHSLSEFVKFFWPVVVPSTPLIWDWYLDAVCDHLQAIDEGYISKLIICVPPGFAKSTIVSVLWPAWTWLRMPWISSLFGSYDENLTYRDSVKNRDVIRSNRYQKLFKPDWQLRSDVSSKGYFANTAQGARKTYYVGSSHSTGWRGNYLVVDDPISAKNRYNTLEKKQVIDNWDGVLSTRVNRNQQHAYVVIMQRLAPDDLVGHLIEKYGKEYVQLILPVMFKSSRKCVTPFFEDPRTEEGQLLAPDFFPQSRIDDMKFTLGEIDFAAQYQHDPYLESGNRFKSEYFQYWNWVPGNTLLINLFDRNGNKTPTRIDRLPRFITVDPASSKKQENDFSSIGLWAKTNQNEIILLDRIKMKGNEFEVINSIKYLFGETRFGRIPPVWVGMETNGVGLPISQNAMQAGLPVIQIPVHTDKKAMSATAVVRVQGGQVYFPDPSLYPWMHEFTTELIAFDSGPHDDDVTMVSLAANSIFEESQGSPREIVTIPQGKPKINVNRVTANLSKHHFYGANGNGK